MMEVQRFEVEEHEFTSDQKLKWFGYGEWVEEPDHLEFYYKGYHCKVIRICVRESFASGGSYYGGYLCGYMEIPKDHLYYGDKNLKLICHGGFMINEPRERHWIGFACTDLLDIIPSVELHRKKGETKGLIVGTEYLERFGKRKYKNIAYVINECKKIVDHLDLIKVERGK